MSAAEQAGRFLAALFPDPQPDERVTTFTGRDKASRHWLDVEKAAAAVARNQADDVYVGMGTRRPGLSDKKRGGNADVVSFGALWLDIDIAGPGHATGEVVDSVEDARRLVDAFPLKPSMSVDTGGGRHVYWLFSEAVTADEFAPLLDQWAAWWTWTCERLGMPADPSVWTLDRVLRVPGTNNCKIEPLRPVTLRIYEPDRRYGVDDIEQHLGIPEGWQRPASQVRRSGGGGDWQDLTADDLAELHPLTRDTWEVVRDQFGGHTPILCRDGDKRYVQVVRPIGAHDDKAKRGGISGTIGYVGPDVFYCLTNAWPPFVVNNAYGLETLNDLDPEGPRLTASEFRKKQQSEFVDQFAKAKQQPPAPPAGVPQEPSPVPGLESLHLIDWAEFWTRETSEEWLAEPILPRGRSVALVAGGKSGKSLLLVDVAIAVATGRPILGRPNPNGPQRVLYLDYEMTQDDLYERLEDMGYGPDTDLSTFHYSLLPSIAPLDTEAGGQYVLQAALQLQADLVIIDTLARAVSGAEDSADTYRAFYLYTSMLLKQHGITAVRADHTGHSEQTRARGSSAKADDVDVVWSAKRTDNGLELTRTHSRVPWVPTKVTVLVKPTPLRHVVSLSEDWPPGTADLAKLLDEYGVPLDASVRNANDMIKARSKDGTGRNTKLVGKALKYRREKREREQLTGLETPPETPSQASSETGRETRADNGEVHSSDQGILSSGNTPGNTWKQQGAERETCVSPIRGNTLPPAGSATCVSCRRDRSTDEIDAAGRCSSCAAGLRRAAEAVS